MSLTKENKILEKMKNKIIPKTKSLLLNVNKNFNFVTKTKTINGRDNFSVV